MTSEHSVTILFLLEIFHMNRRSLIQNFLIYVNVYTNARSNFFFVFQQIIHSAQCGRQSALCSCHSHSLFCNFSENQCSIVFSVDANIVVHMPGMLQS